MSAESSIEWTDKTWNPTVGCTRVSEGCRNCYAFTLHDMRHAAHQAGKKLPAQYAKPFKELQLFPDRLTTPLSWRKPCRVFVNSMSDLFHKDVPDEFIDRVFATMALADRHTFQVLTKRPERMRDYCSRWGGADMLRCPRCQRVFTDKGRDRRGCPKCPSSWSLRPLTLPLPNVWLGVSVENRKAADERMPFLEQTPAAVRFLSCEPLLGPMEFSNVGRRSDCVNKLGKPALDGIGWVIVGGESGPGSRACQVEWVRSVVRQCDAVGVPVFVKQLGSNPRELGDVIGDTGFTAVPSLRLRDRKGGDMKEFPTDLQVRQFPAAG